MEQTIPQNLKYGIIYLYSDRSFSPGVHDAESIVEKFVCPLQVEWIDEPGREDLFLVARRFNVGNIGKYATVSLSLSRMNRSGGWFEAIRRFADELMGVTDAGDGDVVINEADFGYRYDLQSSVFDGVSEAAPQDNTRVNLSKKVKVWKRLTKHFKVEADKEISCEEAALPVNRQERPRRDQLQEEEEHELKKLEQNRKRALEQIKRDIVNYIAKYHDDPKELMAELLRGKVVVGHPGRILVNGDMKIVLPDYDEMEIEMPALCRTLYILFLKRRLQGGGIVLKNMDEYHDEIINIYSMVKPGANDNRVAQSVDNLCSPFSDSLNQMISKINRRIKNVITDKELAKMYIITGKKGEAYSIGLSPDYLELPRAITS
jgi:hypothetical protein